LSYNCQHYDNHKNAPMKIETSGTDKNDYKKSNMPNVCFIKRFDFIS